MKKRMVIKQGILSKPVGENEIVKMTKNGRISIANSLRNNVKRPSNKK